MSLAEKFQNRFEAIQSLLSVGLDPEWEKLPEVFRKDTENGLFLFCKEIIDATKEHALAYKPNIAFFERFGSKGFRQLETLIDYIKDSVPDSVLIADAKRGDLSNTAKEYARYYFERLGVDVLTVSPYMGRDSLIPYLQGDLGSIFLLCLTSNPSAVEFQKWEDSNRGLRPGYLHQGVAKLASHMNKEFPGRVGIVTGGTRAYEIESIRKEFPDLIFLVPGYGAQGGDLRQIVFAGGLKSIINSSRGIHFLSSGPDFAKKAKQKSEEIHKEMRQFIKVLLSKDVKGSL
jgi:orotidine-5'-phosphate decarboxylase